MRSQTNPEHPGWIEGWAVIKGDWPHRTFDGIYETREEAQFRAAEKGAGWVVRWGAYDRETRDFVSGDNP